MKMSDLSVELDKALPMLRARARRHVGALGDADELVSSAVEKMCRYVHTFKDGSNFEAWATTILKNEWRSGVGRVPQHEEYQDALEKPSSWRPPPQEMVVAAKEALRRMNLWPPEERRAFQLLAEERDWDEVAHFCGMSVQGLANLIHRVRKRMEAEDAA